MYGQRGGDTAAGRIGMVLLSHKGVVANPGNANDVGFPVTRLNRTRTSKEG